MAGTYPTSPEFASIGFGSEQKTITSTTDSGKCLQFKLMDKDLNFQHHIHQ